MFPSKSANGAYCLYGVGKNRLEMSILFDAKKVGCQVFTFETARTLKNAP